MARQPAHLAEQQRILGRYLAALREAAGLYQADIARAVPCHRTTVSHAEAGSQLPDSTFWEIADQVIGANGALIASYDKLIKAKLGHHDQQQANRRARAQATVRQLTDPQSRPEQASPRSRAQDSSLWVLATDPPGGNFEGMMRRELLRLLSMAGVAMAIPDTDERIDRPGHSFITLAGSSNAVANDYATLNTHLWRVFVLSQSKGAVLPLVRDQLDVLVASFNESRGLPARRRLCELASELLQLAGEIFFDANEYTDAAHCYTLAANASKEANAFDLWACAMTRHAFIEMHERRFDKAAPMLELAERLARRGDESLSTRYWISSVRAQAFAGLGELDACQRALDTAEQVRELSGDASNGGWLRFDGTRLAEERGACYVQLRRPDLAEDALGDALRQNLSVRRRATVLTDLAIVGAQRSDVNQLITHAEAVLEIAAQTGSGFVKRKLHGLRNYLAPLLENGRVRQLDQQIMAVSGSF